MARNRRTQRKRRPAITTPETPIKRVEATTTLTRHSGPLPAPADLAEYNAIVPGSAERIIKMAEDEAEHRRQIEATVISETARHQHRGQLLGFVIACVGISASVITSITGDVTTASTLGGSSVLGLVAVFVVGRLIDKD